MSTPVCDDPTVYGPCAPYLDIDGLLCPTTGLDIGEGDPDADPDPIPEGEDRALLIEMLLYASRRVFIATGYRFGGCCESTIRPPGVCCPICGCVPLEPCGCTRWPMLALPFLPVRGVDEILVDGEVLDPAAYALIDGAWLARVDDAAWPQCNDLTLPTTEVGTWSITFRHGLDLPPEAVHLVGQYAVELAKSCRGGECALGPNISVVHRDGVDFQVLGEKGPTGFGPLDDWISLLNGGHVTEPPRIYRPGREHPYPVLEPAVAAS